MLWYAIDDGGIVNGVRVLNLLIFKRRISNLSVLAHIWFSSDGI